MPTDQVLNGFSIPNIESGIPAIIGLALPNGTGHAVVGIGHSSDFTRTLSPGIRWSHEYFSGLIMNDDNLPPYRSVLIDSQPDRGADTGYTLDNVDGFVVPLYEKIYLAAKDAFTIVEEIISHERTGLSRFQPPGLPPDDSLIRLFLTSSRSWKRNYRSSRIPGGLGLLYSAMPMPRCIWVAELSYASALSGRSGAQGNSQSTLLQIPATTLLS